MNKFVILFALILTVSFSSAFSQSIGNQQKLTPEKNSKGRFGEAVLMTDDFAFVSSVPDYYSKDSTGTVFIYIKKGGDWVLHSKITQDLIGFGGSIAIHGKTLIVGTSDKKKQALIYELSGNEWKYSTTLMTKDRIVKYSSESTVALSENYAIVGDRFDKKVYIFQKKANEWTHIQTIDNPTKPTKYSITDFGSIIAISDQYLILGDGPSDEKAKLGGVAFIYQVKKGQWELMQKIFPSEIKYNSGFGNSVAIHGNTAFINSYKNTYFFELEAGKWIEKSKTKAAYRSISVSDKYLLLSDPYDTDKGEYSGAVTLFSKQNGSWKLLEKIYAKDAGVGHMFGETIHVTNKNAIISASCMGDVGKVEATIGTYIIQLK